MAGGNKLALLTFLDQASGYEQEQSVIVNYGANNEVVDVHYSLDSKFLIFFLDGDTTSAILNFGTIDLTVAFTVPVTTRMFTFTAESGRSFDLTVGLNFGVMENESTVYLAIRGPPLETVSEINYTKLDLSVPTVSWHLRNSNKDGLDGASVSLIAGEFPATAVYVSGYIYGQSGNSYEHALWIVKGKTSDG